MLVLVLVVGVVVIVFGVVVVGFGVASVGVSIGFDYPEPAATSGLHADVWWWMDFHD